MSEPFNQYESNRSTTRRTETYVRVWRHTQNQNPKSHATVSYCVLVSFFFKRVFFVFNKSWVSVQQHMSATHREDTHTSPTSHHTEGKKGRHNDYSGVTTHYRRPPTLPLIHTRVCVGWPTASFPRGPCPLFPPPSIHPPNTDGRTRAHDRNTDRPTDTDRPGHISRTGQATYHITARLLPPAAAAAVPHARLRPLAPLLHHFTLPTPTPPA